MTELEGLIRFWERVLFDFRFLMEPATLAHVENTIKYLQELRSKKASEK